MMEICRGPTKFYDPDAESFGNLDNDRDFSREVDPTLEIRRLTLKECLTEFSLSFSSSIFPHVTELDLSSD